MTATEIFPELRDKRWWYFADFRLRYALALLFLGLVLANFPVGKLLLLFGFMWIGGSLFLRRLRPPEEEVDGLFAQETDALVAEAARRFRVEDQDLRVKPLVLRGPIERNIPDYYRFLSGPRTGRDGRRRSPINRVVILLPMENRLGIYSCQCDLLRYSTSHVSMEEHGYKDVVSLRLEQHAADTAVKSFDGTAPIDSQVLTLELANGKKLAFPVAEGRTSSGADEEKVSSLEKTMRSIQALLR
ncbi:MAG TPA: hypothetical protein VF179_27585 [Thermoanaerobaculia bacterium]|nr:hypothetical protein [Thermoanaerobaculia bacterium]